jgi:hypothetical protein
MGCLHGLLERRPEQVGAGRQLTCCAGAKKLGLDFRTAQRRRLSRCLARQEACRQCEQQYGGQQRVVHGLSFSVQTQSGWQQSQTIGGWSLAPTLLMSMEKINDQKNNREFLFLQQSAL